MQNVRESGIIVCRAIVPDPVQTLEPVAPPPEHWRNAHSPASATVASATEVDEELRHLLRMIARR